MRPSFSGAFGESPPLKQLTNVHLSVHFVRENEATCSLAVWACVVPPSVMQHVVLLRRNNEIRINSLSYRSLPPRPSDKRDLGELELLHHATTGMSGYAIDPVASGGGFHLRCEGAAGVTLSDNPQPIVACFEVMASRQELDTTWST